MLSDPLVLPDGALDGSHADLSWRDLVYEILRHSSLLTVLAQGGPHRAISDHVCLCLSVGFKINHYFVGLPQQVFVRECQDFLNFCLLALGAIETQLFLIFVNVVVDELVLGLLLLLLVLFALLLHMVLVEDFSCEFATRSRNVKILLVPLLDHVLRHGSILDCFLAHQESVILALLQLLCLVLDLEEVPLGSMLFLVPLLHHLLSA